MTIIVTGGAGFIGSNFVYLQLKEHPEDRIICLDKLTYAGNLSTLQEAMEHPNFRFVKADIADRAAVEQLFEQEHPDIVVNFAAESHVDRSIENPGIFLQTNIMGTQVLMDACRKYGIQRYHQVSTDEVYGDLPLDRPDLFFTEDTPIHTSSPYSASKASADLLVLLSDIDGLYDCDPRRHADAHLISVVERVDDDLYTLAEDSSTGLGTGGMVTKLRAAAIATAAGCEMVIANGSKPEVLYDIAEGRPVGTRFLTGRAVI